MRACPGERRVSVRDGRKNVISSANNEIMKFLMLLACRRSAPPPAIDRRYSEISKQAASNTPLRHC